MRGEGKKILITNVHSTCNAGDLALLESVIYQVEARFDHPSITIVSNWPEEPYFKSSQYPVVPSPWYIVGAGTRTPVPVQMGRLVEGFWLARKASVSSQRPETKSGNGAWKALFDAYHNADLVIAVSGNQLYSTGKYGWPFPVNAMSAELAHIFRRPFYVMPQSIGPLRRKWERWIVRLVYGRARGVFCREKRSLELAQEIGIPSGRCFYAPDPAFTYHDASPAEAVSLLSRYGYQEDQENIGITIIASMGRALDAQAVERYYEAFSALFNFILSAPNRHIYVFNQVTGPSPVEDDRTAVRRVLAKMGERAQCVTFVDEVLPPSLLKACYGKMQFFIASRLHSGIFAFSKGVPTLFINYLTKTRGVLDTLNLSDWVVDLTSVTDRSLIEAFQQGWENRAARAQAIAAVMPGIAAQVDLPMQWIVKDYETIKQS